LILDFDPGSFWSRSFWSRICTPPWSRDRDLLWSPWSRSFWSRIRALPWSRDRDRSRSALIFLIGIRDRSRSLSW